jgi:hypothetical protein
MTVIFHNSSAEVWTALRTAVSEAGFAVRGTQTFDKEHGTFKQFVSDNAVGYDLILHCRKGGHTEPTRKNNATAPCKIADFVRQRVALDPDRYRVHFLHVSRTDEWDFRKLHAEWLVESLPENRGLLGLEEFRNRAESAVADVKLKPFQDTLL